MEFGKRLKAFRSAQGMTQLELADAIGASVVGVRNWELGKRKPTMDMLLALGRALNTSIDALLGFSIPEGPGNHPLLSSDEQKLLLNYQSLDKYGKKTVETICLLEKERVDALSNTDDETAIELPTSVNTSERFIPRYTTPSAAGFNVPLDGAEFEMILANDCVPSDADYAVDIQGDSMYPYICDGDMVYVKKTTELSMGDVGIFCVNGAMYCKQYYIDDEGTLILVSANPELKHTNVIVRPDSSSSVRCCGKVLLNQRIDLPNYIFEN
jgi:phage repressor protein C with HTH and peptisase S24 domain/DNA-binding XRE family transcriptional regulator